MGTIYSGFGLGNNMVGSMEGDTVYRGFGLSREIVGSIEGDTVYSGFGLGRKVVGTISGNDIYLGFGLSREVAGSIEGDTVYRGFGLGREIAGSCTSVEEAAALLLLLEPYAPKAASATQVSRPSRPHADLGEFAALYYITMLVLIAIVVFGSILIWPIIFSSEMQAEPGAAMYTALTIGVSIIGLMVAVRWGSRKRFFDFLFLAAISGGALLDIVLFFIDRPNWTIPRALFAVPFIIFCTCGIPGLIIWMVLKRNGKLKK